MSEGHAFNLKCVYLEGQDEALQLEINVFF